MAYNTAPIARNDLNEPLPQYYNPTTDAYEVIQGRNGASRVELYGPDGNPIGTTSGRLNVLASELDITLSALRDAITAASPNNKTLNDLYTRLAEVLGRNIAQWGGVAVTGRDISLDLAKLDITLSALRDAITAASPNSKTLYDLYYVLATSGIMIGNSQVAVPLDKQAIYRTQAFGITTPLAASASFTSATFDGILYRRITGRVFADQAGTLNLQHSDDGTTWDTLTSISVSANEPAKFDELIYCRYVRVNYVNGATAQTVFRLSGYLSVE